MFYAEYAFDKIQLYNNECLHLKVISNISVKLEHVLRTRKTGKEMPTGCWLQFLKNMLISFYFVALSNIHCSCHGIYIKKEIMLR